MRSVKSCEIIACAFAVCLAIALLSLSIATGSKALGEEVIESFTIGHDGDGVFLPVQIAGTTHFFILDTGCTRTVIDKSLIDLEPDESTWLRAPSGPVKVAVAAAPEARIGKEELRATVRRVVCADLTSFREAWDERLYGLLGMDFLSNKVVRIDFDRGVCELLGDLGTVPEEPIRFKLGEFQQPQIKIENVWRSPKVFTIDTGASGDGILKSYLAKQRIANGSARDVGSALFQDLNKIESKSMVQLDELPIGGHLAKGPVFSTAVFDENRIGMQLLSRFVVTFDFPKKSLYLRPTNRLNEPESIDRSGLHIIRRDGIVVVDTVDAMSPAAEADIRPGDTISEIAGVQVAGERLVRLRRLLRQQDANVLIVGRRGEEILRLSMHLK
ncbi:MAG TPA: aspartyl protease family protein [Pirellulales bacterium]|nr:aspartyl protease family protein [Pirellulales bacterium]